MTEQYTPPFEGGKDPDPTTTAKTANRAKRLARRAMKKAAMKEEADKSGLSPEQIARRKAMDADDFKKRREEMNARRQAGTTPLRTTYREEVELDEAATKPKSVWQQAAIDGRKKGTELGKKTAEEFHKNVNAKGIHKGHPEHSDLFYKHVDKFSYKKLSKNFTTKGVNDAVAEHASNAAHNTFMRHIDKLHDTAMKKDPAYKAKFDKNEADNEKRSEQYRKDYELANDIVSRKVHPTRHGTPSPEAMHAAMINHYGDAEGNLPRHMGGRGTSAERARAHYNMWVAGTGGHGDRGYRYEEVDLEEAKDSREYDYEGDMAMSQLKSVITHAQKLHDMLDPDTNLPEWVQSKITLAEDYIVTAANYMDGEMNEDAQQDYAHTSAVAADKKRRAASDFADKGFKNPVLSPAQRERRQELSRAATSTSDMESAKFLNPKRPVGSHPDRVIRGLNKDTEQARIGMRALTAKVRAEKKPNLPEEVEQVEEGLVGSLVKAYVSPKAQALVSKGVGAVAGRLGASPQTKRRLQKAGIKWARRKIGEDVEQIEEKKMGYEKLASAIKSRVAKKKLAVEAHDPVGKEDADINNDGKTDKTDVYLHTKRRAIGKAISTRLAAKAGK